MTQQHNICRTRSLYNSKMGVMNSSFLLYYQMQHITELLVSSFSQVKYLLKQPMTTGTSQRTYFRIVVRGMVG